MLQRCPMQCPQQCLQQCRKAMPSSTQSATCQFLSQYVPSFPPLSLAFLLVPSSLLITKTERGRRAQSRGRGGSREALLSHPGHPGPGSCNSLDELEHRSGSQNTSVFMQTWCGTAFVSQLKFPPNPVPQVHNIRPHPGWALGSP